MPCVSIASRPVQLTAVDTHRLLTSCVDDIHGAEQDHTHVKHHGRHYVRNVRRGWGCPRAAYRRHSHPCIHHERHKSHCCGLGALLRRWSWPLQSHVLRWCLALHSALWMHECHQRPLQPALSVFKDACSRAALCESWPKPGCRARHTAIAGTRVRFTSIVDQFCLYIRLDPVLLEAVAQK